MNLNIEGTTKGLDAFDYRVHYRELLHHKKFWIEGELHFLYCFIA